MSSPYLPSPHCTFSPWRPCLDLFSAQRGGEHFYERPIIALLFLLVVGPRRGSLFVQKPGWAPRWAATFWWSPPLSQVLWPQYLSSGECDSEDCEAVLLGGSIPVMGPIEEGSCRGGCPSLHGAECSHCLHYVAFIHHLESLTISLFVKRAAGRACCPSRCSPCVTGRLYTYEKQLTRTHRSRRNCSVQASEGSKRANICCFISWVELVIASKSSVTAQAFRGMGDSSSRIAS